MQTTHQHPTPQTLQQLLPGMLRPKELALIQSRLARQSVRCTCGRTYTREGFYGLRLHGRLLPEGDPAGVSCAEGQGTDLATRECECGNGLCLPVACTHAQAPVSHTPALVHLYVANQHLRRVAAKQAARKAVRR